MPVSTFSPAHSVRPRGGPPLISRWTSTRDRIDADEQRSSMQELDLELNLGATGLYDRPDWPLHFSQSDQQDRRRHKDPAELEDERVDEGAVLRRLEDISPTLAILNGGAYTTKHDVSDLEEEEEGGEGEEEDDDDDDDSSSLGTPSPPRPTQHEYHQPSYRLQSYSSHSRAPQHHRLAPPGSPRRRHAEVSPVREEHHASSRSRGIRNRTTSLERERARQHQAAQQQLLQQLKEDEEEQEEDEDSDFEESRDVAPPLSYSTSSPALQQGTTPNTSPWLNGDAFSALTTNDRADRPSSMAKESMHSQADWRLSKRSSIYNTTQIPHQKERVRYSWQSIQDDEPNRPRIHVIKLFSQTVTASAAFPTGEAFGFSISAGGRRIAAYNSARLYVLQTNALPVGISQDYALKRRPVDIDLTDEGNTLAILADDHTINVYELGHELRRTKTLTLDFPTHCIALAPTGGLLAAAYEGGIEVFSLHPNALPTDRRAVRSAKMDRMMFSEDGSTLLGTTTRINVSSTVTVSVPVFPVRADGVPTHEELKEAWCSELLHPENIRNSSHATFMRDDGKTCNDKVFAWNGLEDTFGILNISDMHYGNIDFPVVISPPLSTCGGLGAAIHSCPSVDEHGETVAMIVNDRTVRLYIVPRETGDDTATIEAHSIDHELDEGYGCPFSEVRWVHSSASLPAPRNSQAQVKGRLIVTSPGGVTESGIGEEGVDDVEGGRIILFDFDPQFAGQPGQTFSLTLGKSPPAPLDEEKTSMNEQVNLVRRRTVNQSKSSALNQRPPALGRSATMHGNRSLRSLGRASPHGSVGRSSRNSMLSMGSIQSDAARSLPDLLENGEAADEVFEEPYVQGQPRSHASLQRAASNAQRHRFQSLEERDQSPISVDSTGGFLALPEYTEEPNAPLPSRFRAMAGLDAPTMFNRSNSSIVINVNGGIGSADMARGSSPQAPYAAPPDVGAGVHVVDANHEEDSPVLRPTNSEKERREMRRIEIEQQGMDFISPHSPAASTPSSIPSSLVQFDTRQQARLDHLPRGAGTYSPSSFYDSRSHSPAPQSAVDAYGSFANMPRSLQRAYSNAVSPLGQGGPPSAGGDWQNVSPITRSATSVTGHMENEDAISPVGSQQSVPFARRPTGFNSYRNSTSLLHPPGHSVHRTQPSGATVSTMPETHSAPMQSMPTRRMPPHMQAFRNAAAANASASLFPPSQPIDHVPIRQPTARAGTAAHPITAWHPPAPSTPLPKSSHGTIRGSAHARKNSLGGKSATDKAKKSGFFKKKEKKFDPFAPSGNGEEHWEDGKSVMTWGTKKGEKCVVM